MPVLTDAQARKTLGSKTLQPIYVVLGDDELAKDAFVEAVCQVLDESLRGFNLQRVYANERPISDIVSAARTLPLLGDRRIVVVLRSEVFLRPKRKGASVDDGESEGGAAEDESEGAGGMATTELERYVSSPVPETCLVLVTSDLVKTTRLAKALMTSAVVVEYWGLKGDREMKGGIEGALHAGERFIRDTLHEAGLTVRPDAMEPLIEHAGADINVLRNDLDRLVSYCAGRTSVTRDDVQAVVGGAVQLDQWAVTRAIQFGDTPQALRQLRLGFEAGQSPWMVLGQLGWFVRSRLAESDPARLTGAVEALFRTDLALKSSGGDPEVLLERLVVELCGPPRGAPSRRRAPGVAS